MFEEIGDYFHLEILRAVDLDLNSKEEHSFMTQTEEGYMFPFGDINGDALVDINKGCVGEHMYTLCRKFENLNFKSFDNTEHKM